MGDMGCLAPCTFWAGLLALFLGVPRLRFARARPSTPPRRGGGPKKVRDGHHGARQASLFGIIVGKGGGIGSNPLPPCALSTRGGPVPRSFVTMETQWGVCAQERQVQGLDSIVTACENNRRQGVHNGDD